MILDVKVLWFVDLSFTNSNDDDDDGDDDTAVTTTNYYYYCISYFTATSPIACSHRFTKCRLIKFVN